MPRVRRRPSQAVRLDRCDLQRLGLLPHRLAGFVEHRFVEHRFVQRWVEQLDERKRWRIVDDIVIIDFGGIFVVVLTPRTTTPGRPA
jgi:hypothetical protein